MTHKVKLIGGPLDGAEFQYDEPYEVMGFPWDTYYGEPSHGNPFPRVTIEVRYKLMARGRVRGRSVLVYHYADRDAVV